MSYVPLFQITTPPVTLLEGLFFFQAIMLLDFAFQTNSFTVKDLLTGVTWKLPISTDMHWAVTKISRLWV